MLKTFFMYLIIFSNLLTAVNFENFEEKNINDENNKEILIFLNNRDYFFMIVRYLPITDWISTSLTCKAFYNSNKLYEKNYLGGFKVQNLCIDLSNSDNKIKISARLVLKN